MLPFIQCLPVPKRCPLQQTTRLHKLFCPKPAMRLQVKAHFPENPYRPGITGIDSNTHRTFRQLPRQQRRQSPALIAGSDPDFPDFNPTPALRETQIPNYPPAPHKKPKPLLPVMPCPHPFSRLIVLTDPGLQHFRRGSRFILKDIRLGRQPADSQQLPGENNRRNRHNRLKFGKNFSFPQFQTKFAMQDFTLI